MNLVEPVSVEEWRGWLAANAGTEREAWLVIPHKATRRQGVGYAEAIEQALCFGWIDGLHRKHDATSSQLRFSPRSPRSTWSASNRERVRRMTEAGLMTPAGQALVDLSHERGTWEVHPHGEEEVRRMLEETPGAAVAFAGFPPSVQRLTLEWIAKAKRPETRERRIRRTVELAAEGKRAVG